MDAAYAAYKVCFAQEGFMMPEEALKFLQKQPDQIKLAVAVFEAAEVEAAGFGVERVVAALNKFGIEIPVTYCRYQYSKMNAARTLRAANLELHKLGLV